ncbi:MAG: SUMF1/EgtB/PvdO family nonheme iron enzyme [Bacteroidota bacterium]
MDIAIINDLFVTIPKGSVDLRDDRTKTTWSVDIDSFELCKFPVTQEIYEAVINENPSTIKGRHLPVETVSWIQAVTFCNALSQRLGRDAYYRIDLVKEKVTLNFTANGFRLPTEAEWQYACQAGIKGVRYGELNEVAWYKDNSDHRTREVGQKKPNPWGLYDMLGNVWEWCSDIYDETVYGTYRVFRGGGWCDQERSVMATTRRRSHPFSFKIDDLGFRIATNAKVTVQSIHESTLL